MSVIGILLCGGSSQRMGFNKLTTPLGGSTALERSASLLAHCGCDRLVIAVTEDTRPGAEALRLAVPVTLCDGGSTRGQSVLNALRAANGQPGDIAVIHDAARCFQTEAAVRAAIASAKENGSGIASLPMADSVFETDTQRPLDRSRSSGLRPLRRSGSSRSCPPMSRPGTKPPRTTPPSTPDSSAP